MRLDLTAEPRGWISYRYRGIPFAFWTPLPFEAIDDAQAELIETQLTTDGDGSRGLRLVYHGLVLKLDSGAGLARIKVNYRIEGRAPTKAIKFDSAESLGCHGLYAAESLAVQLGPCPEPEHQPPCLAHRDMIWQIHNMPVELESPSFWVRGLDLSVPESDQTHHANVRLINGQDAAFQVESSGEWPPVEIARDRLNSEPRWQDLDQGQRGWAVSGRQNRESDSRPPRPWGSTPTPEPATPEQLQAAIDADLSQAFGPPRLQTIQDLQAQRDAVRAKAIAEARSEPVTRAIGTLATALVRESAQGLLSLEGNPAWEALKEAATALQEAIAETQAQADANMGLIDINKGGLFK